jgi:hypothetical protein
MANYPTSLDTITNPTSGNTLDNPSHSLQHSEANDILEALERKVGIGSSVAGSATSGHVFVASTGGTTSWTTVGTAGITSGTATNGQVLTANGSGAVSFVTPPGKILQVVFGNTTTSTSSSSSTYADTSLTASITPSSASNKVLVILNQASLARVTNITGVNLKLFRGATELAFFQQEAAYSSVSATTNIVGSAGIAYLDTPASTSSLTYKTQFASQNNVGTVYVQYASTMSTIILMEVAP